MNWPSPRRLFRRRRAIAALATLALVALGVAVSSANQACIYTPSLVESGDAGLTSSACSGNAPAMPGATIPPPPAADDESRTQNLTVVVAMQSIDIGVGVGPDGGLTIPDGSTIPENAPQPHIGLNLDNACTCCGSGPSCMESGDAAENCDDDAGRDNTGIKLFRLLGGTAVQGNRAVNQAMADGVYGLVIELTGYNGQLNDRQVTASIFASNGVLETGDAGPRLDGTDKWTVDPRYLNNSPPVGTDCENNPNCTPYSNFTDPFAYVTCGVLVAHPSSVSLTFGGRAAFGGTEMVLQEPYIVGTLAPTQVFGNALAWSIQNGSISGRWRSSDFLANMATIPDPSNDAGQFLCGTDQVYRFLKPIVCGLQDIVSLSGHDNMNQSCDSISMAFGFTAAPAQLGLVAPIPQQPQGCLGAGDAPFSDSCPSL